MLVLTVDGSVQHGVHSAQVPTAAGLQRSQRARHLTLTTSGPSTRTLGGCTPVGRQGLVVTSTHWLLLVPPLTELPRTRYSYCVQGLRAGSLSINFMARLLGRVTRLLTSSFPLTRLWIVKFSAQPLGWVGGCQDTMTDVGVYGNSSGLGMPSGVPGSVQTV